MEMENVLILCKRHGKRDFYMISFVCRRSHCSRSILGSLFFAYGKQSEDDNDAEN